jgi:hypothetical protein
MATPTKSNLNLTPKDAIRELWARGKLSWKLHQVQQKMLNSYISQNQEITTISCSRQLGKTYFLCVLAMEQCIQHPNSIVKFVCPKKAQVKKNIEPKMRELLVDCPPEMRPEYKTNDYLYLFPNGSQIQLAGTDGGHYETLRGTSCHLWIIDEAGFCDNLDDVVRSVLSPTTDTTGGKGILVSTPSISSDHEFITEFLNPAEAEGTLIKYTIYDNPLITPEKLQKIINRYPLKEKDPVFRREYLCEVQNNGELSIVPEFTKTLEEKIVKVVDRPPFFDAYVGMDIGGKDLTVVIFGYWDFLNARLVIEDELVFGKSMGADIREFRIDQFATEINKIEQRLWTNKLSGEFKAPYLRIADNNNIIFLNDLTYKYNLQFIPTRKDNRDAAINSMRQMIADERIIINPKCETLIRHLKHGVWAKNKKDFARSSKNGHYDAIPALYYLIRNLQEHKNPYPPGYQHTNKYNIFDPGKKEHSPKEQAWISMFSPKTSLKFKK